MAFAFLGHQTGVVADIASAVIGSIGIEHFLVPATRGHANSVVVPHYRCKVTSHHHKVRWVGAASQVDEDTVVVVVAIDPLETRMIEILLMQGGFRAIQLVQVGDESLNSLMGLPLQEIPLEVILAVPLRPLGYLASHEAQLLTRMGPLVAVQQAEIGETAAKGRPASGRALNLCHAPLRRAKRAAQSFR